VLDCSRRKAVMKSDCKTGEQEPKDGKNDDSIIASGYFSHEINGGQLSFDGFMSPFRL
jgi:hypothetical protein